MVDGSQLNDAFAPLTHVAGRYRVEAELAVGGMGAVYRVHDESTGRALALKRLHRTASKTATLLFRKEYHTLVALRHPRIIEVYEFGLDGPTPYYTMELLDGADLSTRAPLPYRQACAHLRDVASSLALLHARRLLHRDLSPRNVRATTDGRCKLFDFGALAPFGVPSELVGTLPFVPFEALCWQPLDQRADLYSLGALAYFLLTGSHAYPAKSLDALRELWNYQPPPPSQRRAELTIDEQLGERIPRTLDELVMSLLSRDALARPASAAEVIDRLTVAASLEPETEAHAAHSYLRSSPLIGRNSEIARLCACVTAAMKGRGGIAIIEQQPGLGGTRLLIELVREAQMAGAVAIRVDADLYQGPYATLRALIEALLAASPLHALGAAREHADALGFVHPELLARLERRAPHDLEALGAWRARVQAAMVAWLAAVARERALVLAIDGLERVDESSAAALAALAEGAKTEPILIVATLKTHAPVSAPAATRRMTEAGTRVLLEPLSGKDVSECLELLFGDVPNLERFSHWLHRWSGGNPEQLMTLVEELVLTGRVRYIEGTWALPSELSSELAPRGVTSGLDRRLALLGRDARRLAEALSVHRGVLTLDLVVMFAEQLHQDPFPALDELVSHGVLVGHGENYHFAQPVLRDRLLETIDEPRRKQFHRRLGDRLGALPAADFATRLQAGWHLYDGGDEERGAELLRRVGTELASFDELPAAVPALQAALSVFRKLKRPRHELLGLLAPLSMAGYYVDRALAIEYGDETLQLLTEETGVALAGRARPWVGPRASLLIGLASSAVRHAFGARGGLSGLYHRITTLSIVAGALTGTATICFDRERALRGARALAPFAVLGQDHPASFGYELCSCLALLTEDRAGETVARLRPLLARVRGSKALRALPSSTRDVLEGGVLYALGALETFYDEPLALERARELEGFGLQLYDMLAWQLRANYHAWRGEADLAREHEKRVESYAVRAGSAWQAEVWAAVSRIGVCLVTCDTAGMKRGAEELDRLAAEIPSLGRYAQIAHGCHRFLHGDYDAALRQLEPLVLGVPPRLYQGWTNLLAALASIHNERGEHRHALDLCNEALRTSNETERAVLSLNVRLEVQLALAKAGLGETEFAAGLIDDLLAKHAGTKGPLTLGTLHAARARIAWMQGDTAELTRHREQMERWFRSTANPALIAQCERMPGFARQPSELPMAKATTPSVSPSSSLSSETATLLDGPPNPRDRR